MKTRRYNWVALFLLLFVMLAISASTYQLLVKKCMWWACAPVREFTVYDLSLPDYLFPDKSGMSHLYSDRGIVDAVEEVRSTSHWEGGGAIYKILRFATENQASKWYSVEIQLNLFTRSSVDMQESSNVKLYKNDVPNQSAVDCGYVLDDFRCVYWARYQEFFIFFSSSIDNEQMRPDDFARILDYINEKAGSLLK